jgi:hypothetical protein
MRIPKGQSKMDNPEKLATYGTQDEEKQNRQYCKETTLIVRKKRQSLCCIIFATY